MKFQFTEQERLIEDSEGPSSSENSKPRRRGNKSNDGEAKVYPRFRGHAKKILEIFKQIKMKEDCAYEFSQPFKSASGRIHFKIRDLQSKEYCHSLVLDLWSAFSKSEEIRE
mgnify:CR=1 FL=1